MDSNTEIISTEQLVEWFKLGNKKKEDWKVGTEHEKFAYNYIKEDNFFRPVAYESKNGIESFLKEISKYGWNEVHEEGKIVALKKSNQSITLEPGGQIELSGAPLEDIHSACKETNEHLKLVKEVGKKLNITMLGLGSRPFENTKSIPWMPKPRYKIMKNYMPKKGTNGLDMMLSTCTVQANLDYMNEEDMKKKMLLSVKIQPILTALFANSPLSEGKVNGFVSKRRYVWTHTDPDRCGTLKVAFENDFGFLKYVKFALSVPMYFIRRKNKYIDCSGDSFLDFINGKLPKLEGIKPLIQDWEDHISTIFTEVRLKRFIEVRGADAGNWRRTCALPAFWVGILYDNVSLENGLKLTSQWNYHDVDKLSSDVAKLGLNAKIKNTSVKEFASELIKISTNGLKNRAYLDSKNRDETQYLAVLEEIINSEKTPAQTLLENYNNKWNRDITKLIEEMSY